MKSVPVLRPEIQKLKTECTRRKMSKRGLAREAGVSPSMVQFIFNGEKCPTLDIYKKLARALGFTLIVERRKAA